MVSTLVVVVILVMVMVMVVGSGARGRGATMVILWPSHETAVPVHYGHTRYYVTIRPYMATLMKNSTGMV